MNIIICGTPYWDRISCEIMKTYLRHFEYHFKIHRFHSVRDFEELLTKLNRSEIDNIHAFISHNHSNSETVLSKLNNRKLKSNKNICVTVSSIRDDNRTYDFIASIKSRLSDSIEIFIDVFMEAGQAGYMQFFDALIERWFYYIKCRNEGKNPKHQTVDLHKYH
ncbi:hypothetical protein [Flavivirga algicola]|uniref:Uncharacterized protein n=1 Tax=Flavivirga algicola TaxID=2729136 RepID=A0ABX1RXZ7_9FLAO|nr:hypothetical protein [Flavivirga algicola]NMH87875.1 hypothetical protein [Flavivirga algicola]